MQLLVHSNGKLWRIIALVLIKYEIIKDEPRIIKELYYNNGKLWRKK